MQRNAQNLDGLVDGLTATLPDNLLQTADSALPVVHSVSGGIAGAVVGRAVANLQGGRLGGTLGNVVNLNGVIGIVGANGGGASGLLGGLL